MPNPTMKNFDLDLIDLQDIFTDYLIIDITDSKGNIIFVNKKFCELSKYSEEELLGQNHRLLKSDEHSDEFFTDMWNVLSSGNTWNGEIKNRAKDGTFQWLKTTIVPVLDSEKNIKNYVALRSDITLEKVTQSQILSLEKKLVKQNVNLAYEVESKSNYLIKSERLATIGTIASRVAHDLKNPLTILHTYAEMLTPEILAKLDTKDKEKWLRMQNSIFDMDRIIEDVLDFARTTEIKKKPASFMNILKLSMNHVKSSYGITINLPEENFTIKCDARKIEGVFSNLLNNAVQALDGQGEVNVIVSSDSEFLTVKISDSGPGIPEKNLEKIFEPMFTTKSTGTGLGLVICKSIIEQHGGTLSVSNKPTTFTVTLPL